MSEERTTEKYMKELHELDRLRKFEAAHSQIYGQAIDDLHNQMHDTNKVIEDLASNSILISKSKALWTWTCAACVGIVIVALVLAMTKLLAPNCG